MSERKTWEKGEAEAMTYFFDIGKNDVEIGAILGRPPHSICAKRQKLGLRVKPKKPQIELTAKEVKSNISPQKHADNLPDIGVQMTQILFENSVEREILKEILTTLKETLALFRKIDAKPKEAYNDTKRN